MERTGGEGKEKEGSGFTFARGGPIYTPDLVGPVTSVAEFKCAAVSLLQSLEAELVPPEDFEDEISADELKVFTEEELVERALRESFEDLLSTEPSPSQASQEARQSTNGQQHRKGTKRGRRFDRDVRGTELEGSYLTKVRHLAEIQRKQDEDKSAARLHSFSGISKVHEASAIPNPEGIARMRSLRFITAPSKGTTTQKGQVHRPIPYPEAVLCVEIYHNVNKSAKVQEFLVLGQQFLTELRDNIYCLTDKLMETADQHNPSGYFLIEDTFYNDMRSPAAVNYSAPVMDWMKSSKDEALEKWEVIVAGTLRRKKRQRELLHALDVSKLPEFKSTKMESVRFCDLRFRLGAGYLYCHQGNCNHTVVIRDMRLLHPEDAQNQGEYPLLTFQLRPRQRKCSVCKIYHAAKMTVDDKWAPNNPCYLCINCYFLLHYKEDSSLLYPHSVFDYFHE